MSNIQTSLQQSFDALRQTISDKEEIGHWFTQHVLDLQGDQSPKSQLDISHLYGWTEDYGKLYTSGSVKRWRLYANLALVFHENTDVTCLHTILEQLPKLEVLQCRGYTKPDTGKFHIQAKLQFIADEWPCLAAEMLHKLHTKEAHNFQKKSYRYLIETMFPGTEWNTFQTLFAAGFFPVSKADFCRDMLLLSHKQSLAWTTDIKLPELITNFEM